MWLHYVCEYFVIFKWQPSYLYFVFLIICFDEDKNLTNLLSVVGFKKISPICLFILCLFLFFPIIQGRRNQGCQGCQWHNHFLADQLTLFQPGRADYAHRITTGTTNDFDLPPSLRYQRKNFKINFIVRRQHYINSENLNTSHTTLLSFERYLH